MTGPLVAHLLKKARLRLLGNTRNHRGPVVRTTLIPLQEKATTFLVSHEKPCVGQKLVQFLVRGPILYRCCPQR